MNIKGPYCDPYVKLKVQLKIDQETSYTSGGETKRNPNILYVKSRSSTVLPEFIGHSFAVYNGKEFKTFGVITPDHVGKKFGEFSSTKKPAIYKKKK